MKKIKNIENYIDVIVVSLALVVMVFATVTVYQNNDLKAENRAVKKELKATKKTLKSTSIRLKAYEDYMRSVEEANDNVITDKYTNGYDYTVVVGKDYYSVSPEIWENLSIGQPVDASEWEKAE